MWFIDSSLYCWPLKSTRMMQFGAPVEEIFGRTCAANSANWAPWMKVVLASPFCTSRNHKLSISQSTNYFCTLYYFWWIKMVTSPACWGALFRPHWCFVSHISDHSPAVVTAATHLTGPSSDPREVNETAQAGTGWLHDQVQSLPPSICLTYNRQFQIFLVIQIIHAWSDRFSH